MDNIWRPPLHNYSIPNLQLPQLHNLRPTTTTQPPPLQEPPMARPRPFPPAKSHVWLNGGATLTFLEASESDWDNFWAAYVDYHKHHHDIIPPPQSPRPPGTWNHFHLEPREELIGSIRIIETWAETCTDFWEWLSAIKIVLWNGWLPKKLLWLPKDSPRSPQWFPKHPWIELTT